MQPDSVGLTIGDRHIKDLLNPLASEIDIHAISERLKTIRRFSGDPHALTVDQHRRLVAMLAHDHGESMEVIQWCLFHDHHEAITGDIPGPLKKLIAEHTHVLQEVEKRLDGAICGAAGIPYPSMKTRLAVSRYDRMAETVEWLFILRRPPKPWNVEVPSPAAWGRTARQLFTDTRTDP